MFLTVYDVMENSYNLQLTKYMYGKLGNYNFQTLSNLTLAGHISGHNEPAAVSYWCGLLTPIVE